MCFALAILSVCLCFPVSIYAQDRSSDISARCAYAYIPEIDAVVFEKNADIRRPMASTTKIMTAVVVLENTELDDTVIVPREAVGIEGSSVYLRKNDEFTVQDLLYALLLQSANDAAAALAISVGGSIEGFAEMMNEKARELSLQDTHFTNPHGLDNEEHYTTAKDLARLSAYALSNQDFKNIVSTHKKTFSSLDGECVRTVVNHNKMLLLYEGATGVKTGFTKKSGRCLVSSAEKDGMTVIAVTLDAPSDWQDHRLLLDMSYSEYEKRVFANESEFEISLPVINGEKRSLLCANRDELSAIVKKSQEEAIHSLDLPHTLLAPINQGDILGYIHYKIDGEIVSSSPIIAKETIKEIKYKKGILGSVRN